MKNVAVGISLVVLVCGAHAESLQAHIEAGSKAVHKFMMARDVKGFTKYMKGGVTPDFQYVEDGRTLNFDKMCAGMQMGLGQMKKMIRADVKLVSLSEKGNTAVAMTTHVMEGISVGADKKPHKLSFGGTSADTYIKTGGKWKLSKMAWVKQSVNIDGKPLQMGAAPVKTK